MVAKKKSSNIVGSVAFLIGVILAVIFGFIPFQTWVAWLLVIIGLIIGLLNITVEETQPFLFAGTIFVIVAALGGKAFESLTLLSAILGNFLYLFVPATIIVALRSLWTLGRQ
ncbi:MAG: hypothetical protein QXQ30_00480 [Candidatus Pacearchaeota archaeon]